MGYAQLPKTESREEFEAESSVEPSHPARAKPLAEEQDPDRDRRAGPPDRPGKPDQHLVSRELSDPQFSP